MLRKALQCVSKHMLPMVLAASSIVLSSLPAGFSAMAEGAGSPGPWSAERLAQASGKSRDLGLRPSHGTAKADRNATVRSYGLSERGERTRLELSLTRRVDYVLFALANPYRLVVDLPQVAFELPKGAGRTGAGLVKAFRFGLLSPGQGRVVVDLAGPVSAAPVWMPGKNGSGKIVIDIVPTDEDSFLLAIEQNSVKPPAEVRAPLNEERAPLRDKPRNAKPVVVIDPGHGGIDSGAIGVDETLEKDIVLAVALRLRDILVATGRYSVHLTRSTDTFISLQQRRQLSIKVDADLFVSVHADAIGAKALAEHVKGATVYTLSERASDAEARQLADKENRVDELAGLEVVEQGEEDGVRSILIDLMRRETADLSTVFQRGMLRELKKHIALARSPARSAAFVVLKQTQTPSVLAELGYMSNAEDVRLLRSGTWQSNVAKSIARAIDSYFSARHSRFR